MPTLETILRLVEEGLDQVDHDPAALAARAHLSRFHFDRIVSAALGEPPGALRRRVLLERAAARLTAGSTVVDAAVEAGYESPDGFARAFERAYGMSPSRYRRSGRMRHDLPAGNGVHFHPPGGLALPALRRSDAMDVLTRMFDHHVTTTAAILERLDAVPDPDAPITLSVEGIDEDPTLRRVADRLVRQLEMWATAIEGGTTIPAGDTSAAGLRARLEAAVPRFRAAVVDPIAAGDADAAFVDATCEPPQTFTLGGVLAHVLTFAAVRRTLAIGALETAGIADLGSGDPMGAVGAGPDASGVRRRFDDPVR